MNMKRGGMPWYASDISPDFGTDPPPTWVTSVTFTLLVVKLAVDGSKQITVIICLSI